MNFKIIKNNGSGSWTLPTPMKVSIKYPPDLKDHTPNYAYYALDEENYFSSTIFSRKIALTRNF